MEEKNGKLSVVVSANKTETSVKKRSFWHINREMLPYKLHFFLFVAGAGAIYPFQSAFGITVLGLTASNIAICYTTLQVTIFVLKPGIGYLADYLNRLKAIMIALAVLQLLFYVFMVVIPNTGMPGIHTRLQLTNTSQKNTYCDLCFNSDIFKRFIPKQYLDAKQFTQLSSCLNSNVTENVLINCSLDYSNSSNINSDELEIKQATCNFSSADHLLTEIDTHLKDVNASEDCLSILQIKTPKISYVCLSPTGKFFYYSNISFDDLSQNCYTLSKEMNFKLQYLLTETDITSTNCTDQREKVSEPKDERSISIANFKTYQFWVFAICLVLSCTFGSSEFTMSDTALYESIQGNDYGQQRIWGAIGWGLSAPLAGYLNDSTESYMASCCLCAGFTILQIWNLSKMNLIKPDFSKNILKDMKTIFSSMEFLCFEAGVLMNGMFTGIIWYYLTWFIVSIGGNKLVIGLVHTIQCYFGEVPAMYFSGWLIKKFGHFNIVSLAIISHGIRFFLYSYLHNPWWILPIESLHGLTFGSFYAAMTSYAKLNSKPGTEATTQSILCTTYEALGCGLGCVITGVCLELFGGHTTFFYASFLCLVATLINVFFTVILKYRKGSQDVTQSTSMERY